MVCGSEFRRRIGIMKVAFEKLSNVFRNKAILFERKKRLLNCYVISFLLYDSECWKISMTNRFESTEMCFYRMIQRILLTQLVNNE